MYGAKRITHIKKGFSEKNSFFYSSAALLPPNVAIKVVYTLSKCR